MTTLTVGTDAHKELLCRFFIDTHIRFEPAKLAWPDLDETCLTKLRDLPIWDEAVTTEAETAMKVTELGRAEKDPLLAEAISLQGYEEQRHAEMLRLLTQRYGIPVRRKPNLSPPEDPYWAFLRVGYGECFDSFFGFGLFALARDSGFFTPGLVALFDPVMQEEARHIIFIANWIAMRQARMPAFKRPGYLFRRGLALWLQSVSRIRTAVRLKASEEAQRESQADFTMAAHQSFGNFSPRQFLETCLRESERRMAPYDPRLIRPTIVPTIAQGMLRLMPNSSGAAARS